MYSLRGSRSSTDRFLLFLINVEITMVIVID